MILEDVVYKTRMNKLPVLDIIKVASPIAHSIAFCIYSYCNVIFPAFESLLCLWI